MKKVPIYHKLIIYYENLVELLENGDRASIILPTGTGKSHLVLRYLQTHPADNVLFITSQSAIEEDFQKKVNKYDIFIPNLKKALYGSLANSMKNDRIGNGYECIILDEYRHSGADIAETLIPSILDMNAGAKIIGMDATPIRYLDKRGPKDMTDPLFQGHKAAEVDLYQAFSEGLLIRPNYMTCCYDLSSSFPDYLYLPENEKYRLSLYRKLNEKARRSLDLADGLEEIFAKHLRYPRGKYIVFCRNNKHMRKMIHLAKEKWFRQAGIHPSVYWDSAKSSPHKNDYKAFAEDKTSSLRLLFCIDMFNEGIHLEKIDGVILLRPTSSPNIFYQQIGRCMDISRRDRPPQIIDLVLNVKELQVRKEAFQQSFSDGEESTNPTDPSLKNPAAFYPGCAKPDTANPARTFSEIPDHSVSDPASAYNDKKNCSNPSETSSPDLSESNRQSPSDAIPMESPENTYSNSLQRNGDFFEIPPLEHFHIEQISIDMTDLLLKIKNHLIHSPFLWEIGINVCKEYYRTHHNLDILPGEFYLGFPLGDWLTRARSRLWNKKDPRHLHETQVAELDKMGIDWYFEPGWDAMYKLAREYAQEFGNLRFDSPTPGKYKALPGWISRQRGKKNGKILPPLSARQIQLLEEIGIDWDLRHRPDLWYEQYHNYIEFKKAHPDQPIPSRGEMANLYRWFRLQIEYLTGKKPCPLNRDQIRLLKEQNLSEENKSIFWRNLSALLHFKKEHNRMPQNNGTTKDEKKIYQWMRNQSRLSNLKKLNAEKLNALLHAGVISQKQFALIASP